MRYTYDLNTNGCLILKADAIEREQLRELANEDGEFSSDAEHEAVEKLIANSELEWVAPEEIGALTDAPILGLRDENNNPTSAWAYMDYQVKSFLSDLVACGEAVFYLMTIGTQLAIAIDRASNQTQARILTAYERSLSLPMWSGDYVRRQLDIGQMPSDCLMFLIAEPCWKVEGMRYDNLRDYKREMGITARLRKRGGQRFNPAPCATCGHSHADHCATLLKDCVCSEYKPLLLCMRCKKEITPNVVGLYVAVGEKVFPQYCFPNSGKLHAPKKGSQA